LRLEWNFLKGMRPKKLHRWLSYFDLCDNVGRRPTQLALQHLSNYLLYSYCDDQRQGKFHADGSVTNMFKSLYSLAELEALNLWVSLDAKLQATGGCAAYPFPFYRDPPP